jgi:hypothetical protein
LWEHRIDVIPAKAGIHFDAARHRQMDSRFRGNDVRNIGGIRLGLKPALFDYPIAE